MTTEDLAKRIVEGIEPSEKDEFLDPITLVILMAILSAVIGHYVEKCLNRLDDNIVKRPNRIQRAFLRLKLRNEFRARKAELEDRWLQPTFDSMLRTLAGLERHELASLGVPCP